MTRKDIERGEVPAANGISGLRRERLNSSESNSAETGSDSDDDDDFEDNVQRLTVPGESITSSHAFMRYVPPFLPLDTAKCSSHIEVTEHMSTMKKSLPPWREQWNA